jgi:predicted Zn-dependent protease
MNSLTEMKRPLILAFVFLAFLCFSSGAATAQQCQPLALDLAAQGRNIFTDQQEMYLGDAVYEHLRRDFRVIDDPVVTKYLQGIADRLLQQMPPTQLRFQIALIELPEANALTLPGGRIFVSRKMVALVRDEDELAGVLAHELGHAFAHHSAVDMTYLFKEVLKVDQVTDRQDIFEKYKRLNEEGPHHPGANSKINRHEEGQQGMADLI